MDVVVVVVVAMIDSRPWNVSVAIGAGATTQVL
jgi:hypothetical protein